MELEPGKRYEFTGILTPAAPAPESAGMPGWVYRGGIGLALLTALWLIGQQPDKAAPTGTPSPTSTTQPADVRPGQEVRK
ncbi:hypothetical protein ACFT8W_20950 [Streptomyces hygroscopicus]|uniref:hypothetical protein n=1 Tax=Streptomyces hygroscopicus TaxID=1912 RepID=UPI00363A38AE